MIEDIDVRDNYREIVINDCLTEEEQDEYLCGIRKKQFAQGIYCITNTRYFYIGLAKNIYSRWEQHKQALRGGYHHNPIMQHVYDKYRESDPFVFYIVEECEIDDLSLRESFYIKLYIDRCAYKTCMNITDPLIPCKKLKHVKRAIKESAKLDKIQTGSGSNEPKEIKYNSKTIVQLDLDGNFLKIWNSRRDASKELGVHISLLAPTSAGFLWQKYWDWVKLPKGKILWKYHLKQNINQYDKDGNLLNVFKCINDAAKAVNGRGNGICECLMGVLLTAYGYVWSYGEFPNKSYKRATPSRKRIVGQYDGEVLIRLFSNLKEAADSIGTNATRLRSWIKKGRKFFGYIWKFQN